MELSVSTNINGGRYTLIRIDAKTLKRLLVCKRVFRKYHPDAAYRRVSYNEIINVLLDYAEYEE